MEGGVGAVARPAELLGVRSHQLGVDALAAGVAEARPGAGLVAEGVEGVADDLRVLAGSEQAEDLDLGGAEPAGQALGLAQQQLAGTLVPAPSRFSSRPARRMSIWRQTNTSCSWVTGATASISSM